jgi:hypothetical protein
LIGALYKEQPAFFEIVLKYKEWAENTPKPQQREDRRKFKEQDQKA